MAVIPVEKALAGLTTQEIVQSIETTGCIQKDDVDVCRITGDSSTKVSEEDLGHNEISTTVAKVVSVGSGTTLSTEKQREVVQSSTEQDSTSMVQPTGTSIVSKPGQVCTPLFLDIARLLNVAFSPSM